MQDSVANQSFLNVEAGGLELFMWNARWHDSNRGQPVHRQTLHLAYASHASYGLYLHQHCSTLPF